MARNSQQQRLFTHEDLPLFSGTAPKAIDPEYIPDERPAQGRLPGTPRVEMAQLKALLAIGTRVYNRGDMANIEHFGAITDVQTTKWGTDYQITPDREGEMSSDRAPYWIPAIMVSPEYKGHGGTRIVTEAAYDTWRDGELAKLRKMGA